MNLPGEALSSNNTSYFRKGLSTLICSFAFGGSQNVCLWRQCRAILSSATAGNSQNSYAYEGNDVIAGCRLGEQTSKAGVDGVYFPLLFALFDKQYKLHDLVLQLDITIQYQYITLLAGKSKFETFSNIFLNNYGKVKQAKSINGCFLFQLVSYRGSIICMINQQCIESAIKFLWKEPLTKSYKQDNQSLHVTCYNIVISFIESLN